MSYGMMLPQLTLKEIFGAVYPVGCYYWSSSQTNPSELFGGSWEQIKDRFVLAVGDRHAVGSVGGVETVALTAAQNGPHIHSVSTGRTTVTTTGSGTQWSGYLNDKFSDKGTVTLYSTQSGSGQPHNNMPPYITAYCWRRTA